MEVNGNLKDLSFEITKDSKVRIITSKDKEGLEVIRHDAAHIMAMAVQELFPGTQVTIGPVIENGFYYDFAREQPFTSDDLNKIEKRCQKLLIETLRQEEKFGREIKRLIILKKLEKNIKLKLLKVFQKMKSCRFIIMAIRGMIYAEDLT